MINSFLQYLQYEKNYSSYTVLSYRNDINAFVTFLQQSAPQTDIVHADTEQIRLWLMQQREQRKTATTVNRKLAALRAFYRFLLQQNVITCNPTSKITTAKTPKKVPTFFREKDMNQLLDISQKNTTFEACRDQAILETFYQTGIRLSELLNIKDIDVDFDRQTLRVFGKRRKERVVPFGDGLAQILLQYIAVRNAEIETNTPYLYILRSGKQMYAAAVYRIVHRIMTQISTQQKCSPHVLRHTFATDMLNNGADINAVKKLLGHANLAATQIYTHTTFEQIHNIYMQAHPRADKTHKNT
ncbi:MAG: tyrosine-type recombinase/integrase [Paludibacteraceae bacterium]